MNQAATQSTGHQCHPSILREYDIRGIVGKTLSVDDAFAIGQGFASALRDELGKESPCIAIGRDGRLSSPELSASMSQGMQAAGAQVINIGIGPTPMLYFAVNHKQADGGIMLTGSHNPPDYNGFKMMMGKLSFFGPQIRDLGERLASGNVHSGAGSETLIDLKADYIRSLLDSTSINHDKALTIAWDAGNGAAGEIMSALAKQLAEHGHQSHCLYADIDGTFPNHHPDPSMPENLSDVRDAVEQHGCHIGLAFDGDGDRLGAIDDKGRLISPDHLLMLFARQVLEGKPGSTIIADVKTSQTFFDDVSAQGGKPMIWKTGHSHIKAKMKEVGATFAGEASGHIFFADRYFGFDDGLYAALRLIELVSQLDQPLSTLIDSLPTAHSTPEIRIDCDDERKFTLIDEVKARLEQSGATVNDIDGVRVMTDQGWWLLRASNTQAAIIGRCEAQNADDLDSLIAMLREQLAQSGITVSL